MISRPWHALRLPSIVMLKRLAWTTGSYGGAQFLRLVSNIVLTRLLAPQLFGVMLIVNTLRMGAELASDIGIGQNIVTNPRGNDPAFHNTAWTLQVLRGLILALGFGLAAIPIAHFYKSEELALVLPVFSLVLFIAGLQSTARFSLQRNQQMARYSLFELGLAFAGVIIFIGFALITPTIWALVLGTIASTILTTVVSFFLVPGLRLRFAIDRKDAHEILHFGKWIFASSILYFFALNLDRLFLGKSISLELLGVYGVSRSMADVLTSLVNRIGSLIIFPAVAAAELSGAALRAKLASARLPLLLGTAAFLGVFFAFSDTVIQLLYDPRYRAAAFMLPIAILGVWFAILATIAEGVLLGIKQPGAAAVGNGAKLAWLAIALPIGFAGGGLVAALFVITAADAVRYLPLWWAQRRVDLSFGRQDVLLTLFLLLVAVAARAAATALGLVEGFDAWLALAQAIGR